MSKYIADYITYPEYTCTCCSALPPDFDPEDITAPYQILFDSFKWIREEWGKPMNHVGSFVFSADGTWVRQ